MQIANTNIRVELNSYNLANQIAQMTIFQSLFNKFITAELIINDGIGLLNQGHPPSGLRPLEGMEKLKIVVDVDERRMEFDLIVTAITGVQADPAHLHQTYTLYATSEAALHASQIISGYYNDSASGIIQSLCKNQLRIQKPIAVEQSAGTFKFIPAEHSGYDLIDLMMQKAVSPTNHAHNFVFSENRDQYIFKSIEQIIRERQNYWNLEKFSAPNSTFDRAIEERRILAFMRSKAFDTQLQIEEGAIGAESSSFDVLSKTYTNNVHQLSAERYRMPASGRIRLPDAAISRFPQPRRTYHRTYDPTRTEERPPTARCDSAAFSALLLSDSNIVNINGNPDILPGDFAGIKLPVIDGVTSKTEPEPRVSGDHLITAVAHVITPGRGRWECVTSLEACRGVW